MIKLHEISIYALSEKELSKRYERFKDNFWKSSPTIDGGNGFSGYTWQNVKTS